MMIVRPEGLLPSSARKAELHGEGIAAEITFGTADSVAQAATEFEVAEGELDTPVEGEPADLATAEPDAPPGHPEDDR
jgi:hypothetical protein